jgi:hypothetical protein
MDTLLSAAAAAAILVICVLVTGWFSGFPTPCIGAVVNVER